MTESYTRPDGRGLKQLRDLKIEVGVLDRAEGSARVNLGRNIALASVYGPREMHPKHAARSDGAVMRINYRMASFSVDDYKRRYPSRREKEISKVLSEAYESIVLTENWPRSVIDVHVELLQSDGGTRTAAAIAITAALADAGLPMRDLTGGIASGLYDDQVVLDLTGHEDMKGTGDMPILYSPSLDEISLFQLDGQFTFNQFKEAFFTSMEGIREIVSKMKEALKAKYLLIREEYGVDDEDEEEIDPDLLDEDDDDLDDENDLDDDQDEDDLEDDDEITPVPTEPVGTAHTVTTEEVETPVSDASTTTDEPTSTGRTVTEEELNEVEINNTWFNKSGAELKPMQPGNTDEQDDDEDEDTEEDETENVLRDMEYSQEEDL